MPCIKNVKYYVDVFFIVIMVIVVKVTPIHSPKSWACVLLSEKGGSWQGSIRRTRDIQSVSASTDSIETLH